MRQDGLRSRKKAQTRQRIADAAAALFAVRGYDAVSITEVAQAADVSEQTVYNYFAAKHDLVLDRAEEIRNRYHRAVTERGSWSPAAVLEPLLTADIDRYRNAQPDAGRGLFVVQCVESPVVRRYALEERERQAHAIADAIVVTAAAVPHIVALAHASALVTVIQTVHDEIGVHMLGRAPRGPVAEQIQTTARTAFGTLDAWFIHLMASLRQEKHP